MNTEIEIKKITIGKDTFLDLLLIADPSEKMVREYLDKCELYIMFDNKTPLCAAALVSVNGDLELKNLVTSPAYQRRGFASLMMRFLLDRYKDKCNRMWIGTGSPGDGLEPYYQYLFYQKCGFQHTHTLYNYFTDHYPDPIYEDDGRQCIDMVYLYHSFPGLK